MMQVVNVRWAEVINGNSSTCWKIARSSYLITAIYPAQLACHHFNGYRW